jgi:predicted DNA-binding protein
MSKKTFVPYSLRLPPNVRKALDGLSVKLGASRAKVIELCILTHARALERDADNANRVLASLAPQDPSNDHAKDNFVSHRKSPRKAK